MYNIYVKLLETRLRMHFSGNLQPTFEAAGKVHAKTTKVTNPLFDNLSPVQAPTFPLYKVLIFAPYFVHG